MKAGRELDALVAEKVMGWQWMRPQVGHHYGDGSIQTEDKIRACLYINKQTIEFCELIPDDGKYPRGISTSIPKYSTDIAAAWEVVEKLCNWDVDDNMLVLKGQGPDLEKKKWPDGEAAEWWEAEINGTWGEVEAEADKPALAICLSALKAKGIDV